MRVWMAFHTKSHHTPLNIIHQLVSQLEVVELQGVHSAATVASPVDPHQGPSAGLLESSFSKGIGSPNVRRGTDNIEVDFGSN